MPDLAITLDVPEGLNIDALRDRLQAQVDSIAAHHREKVLKEEAFAQGFPFTKLEKEYNILLGKRGWYENHPKPYNRTIDMWYPRNLDPESPLPMRGSMRAIMVEYGGNNGNPDAWIEKWIDRYARQTKLTCVDADEYRKLMNRFMGKYPATDRRNWHSVYGEKTPGWDHITKKWGAWLDGKFYGKLDEPTYDHLCLLHRKVQRVDKLEDKFKKVKTDART